MVYNIEKYNGKAMGYFSAILEKYNGKAMGYLSAILEKLMARRRDNSLQYWKVKSCEILGWNEECPYEEALSVY